MPDIAPSPVALADQLRPALLRISRRLRQAAQRLGHSAQDVTLLALVRKTPGVGVSALADAEGLSRPTMSAHIRRLEDAGLLLRSSDADDGRRSGLTLAPAGERALEVVRQGRNDWLAARLAALSPEDRKALAAAAPALMRLVGE